MLWCFPPQFTQVLARGTLHITKLRFNAHFETWSAKFLLHNHDLLKKKSYEKMKPSLLRVFSFFLFNEHIIRVSIPFSQDSMDTLHISFPVATQNERECTVNFWWTFWPFLTLILRVSANRLLFNQSNSQRNKYHLSIPYHQFPP